MKGGIKSRNIEGTREGGQKRREEWKKEVMQNERGKEGGEK